ncbi:MAG: hypothetical protein NC253_10070 [Ruminococcus sp.]|nr:hypothetical protein [Ruminococcus sp.]MCM1381024.1 hypothetical protein [Muribaculaceae bacterium]MCM1479198.1 hypothetical protein [Muribaculaceae bacterium]
MSTRETVYSLIDRLNDTQLDAIMGVLNQFSIPKYNEVEPDEIDLQMIAEAEADDSEPIPIEEYAKRLGIDYDSL